MNNRQRKRSALLLLLSTTLSLGGCSSMAPKYARPPAPVPAVWPGVPAAPAEVVKQGQKPAAGIPWQEFFVDGQLRQVIALALKNNHDLRVALLNVRRFRELYQIQQSNLLPKVDISAAADFKRLPPDFSGSGVSKTLDQYRVGLGVASYELDLFGRVASLEDQALEQYLATEQARRSLQISLISQVAAAYLTLAADRERLQLAKETLASQQESYNLTKNRFAAGVSSALALNQAQGTVDAARVDIARYTVIVAQDENALNLLVGSPVAADLLPLSLAESVTSIQDLSPGLPSDVLLSRPDILQAESQLKGASANIGAARAAFFPRISLVSSVGLGSNELSSLFRGESFAWSFLPSISLPIFDGGSNTANQNVAETDRDIALTRYEKAIQNAFREVADALAQRGNIDEQLAAQMSLTAATAESYRISSSRYEKGVDSYLTVLDSQRSMYGAQQNLISTRLARLNNLVTLYKVLGAGAELSVINSTQGVNK